MKISILVATHNRREKLKFLLDTLENLIIPDAVKCEVLVLDNNSNDCTEQVMDGYSCSENPAFRYILEKRQGKSSALNKGISAAEGDVLAFIDDDCVPDPYWIASIVREFEQDPSLSILGGRVKLYDEQDIPHAISWSDKRILVDHPRQICGQVVIMGGNLAIRRDVIGSVRGFDPLLGPGATCRAAEDIDLIWRVYKRGLKMVYSPDAIVFHNHGRRTQIEDDTVSRDYGIGRGGFYFKHILQGDLGMLRAAAEEVYGVAKTLLKSFIVRRPSPYHRIIFPALFLGGFYYHKAQKSSRKMSGPSQESHW